MPPFLRPPTLFAVRRPLRSVVSLRSSSPDPRQAFRPSDWANTWPAVGVAFPKHPLTSKRVTVGRAPNGTPQLQVGAAVWNENPALWKAIMRMAQWSDGQLEVRVPKALRRESPQLYRELYQLTRGKGPRLRLREVD